MKNLATLGEWRSITCSSIYRLEIETTVKTFEQLRSSLELELARLLNKWHLLCSYISSYTSRPKLLRFCCFCRLSLGFHKGTRIQQSRLADGIECQLQVDIQHSIVDVKYSTRARAHGELETRTSLEPFYPTRDFFFCILITARWTWLRSRECICALEQRGDGESQKLSGNLPVLDTSSFTLRKCTCMHFYQYSTTERKLALILVDSHQNYAPFVLELICRQSENYQNRKPRPASLSLCFPQKQLDKLRQSFAPTIYIC